MLDVVLAMATALHLKFANVRLTITKMTALYSASPLLLAARMLYAVHKGFASALQIIMERIALPSVIIQHALCHIGNISSISLEILALDNSCN
jgi:hypothetical protein